MVSGRRRLLGSPHRVQRQKESSDEMKGFAYLIESLVTTERFLGGHVSWRVAAGQPIGFAIGRGLVLLSSLLTIMLTQSIARAGDFSSQTGNPRASYSGVRLQQGNPQFDNDRKPGFGPPSVKTESRLRSLEMQQGKNLRDVDRVNAMRPGNNSAIPCGPNCRK
jgi:hypothetical protein